jgi:hypothetical protein
MRIGAQLAALVQDLGHCRGRKRARISPITTAALAVTVWSRRGQTTVQRPQATNGPAPRLTSRRGLRLRRPGQCQGAFAAK